MVSHADLFNTEKNIDDRIGREDSIIVDMALVSKYLPSDHIPELNENFVTLAKLTLEDFGVCRELFDAAARLSNLNITVVPSSNSEQRIAASLNVAMG